MSTITEIKNKAESKAGPIGAILLMLFIVLFVAWSYYENGDAEWQLYWRCTPQGLNQFDQPTMSCPEQ